MIINVDDIFETKNNGLIKIISYEGRDKDRKKLFLIKFIDTGYFTISSEREIRTGKIKDYLKKNFSGIGFLGLPKKYFINKVIYERAMDIWEGMIGRCYNSSRTGFSSYGMVGVTVEERWHNFYLFYQDIQKIDGWNEDLFLTGKIQLDKDVLQFGEINKMYSYKTCLWIDRSKNTSITKNNRILMGVSPNGEEFIFTNMNMFAKEHGLTSQNIVVSAKNNGKIKHKGWSFEYIDEK